VPSVAAVMGGAMLLAGLGVVSWSEDSLARERHMPIAPPGQAIATVLHDDIDGRREQLDAAAPGNRARLVTFPESRADTDPSPDAPPVTTSWVVLPPHCPEAAFLVDEPRSGACLEAAGSAPYSLPPIVVLDPADAADLFGLTDDQRRLLDEGGVLLPTGGAPARSEVTLAAATWIDAPQDVTPVAVRIAETIPRIEYGFLGQPPGAVISDTTAERLGMDWRVGQFIIGSADGPLSDADARALEALPRTDAREPVQIERGPQSPFRLIWSGAAIVFGLLIIIAVVTATALAQGEARRDIAVLTSLGATSGITRRIAALQAALLAGIGAVLGAAAAFIPALTVVISATTSDLRPFTGGWIDLWNAATIVIPWGWMLLAVATIALIAAGVAAAITRPAPALSRRVT
ncbi:MAG: hypothetical protein Q4G43_13495, partial [Mobilicoccus sp.]|nr:hypothetical protein [Mobilicoccus sp.]